MENLEEIEQTGELGLHKIKEVFEEEIEEGNTKFHFGSLRSGQKLEFDGNLVIVGDVNGGAEVFAAGNIVILGVLRGLAHAGATGNKKTTISAMGINCPQIRIANIVKELEEKIEIKRETASIFKEEIVIEE